MVMPWPRAPPAHSCGTSQSSNQYSGAAGGPGAPLRGARPPSARRPRRRPPATRLTTSPRRRIVRGRERTRRRARGRGSASRAARAAVFWKSSTRYPPRNACRPVDADPDRPRRRRRREVRSLRDVAGRASRAGCPAPRGRRRQRALRRRGGRPREAARSSRASAARRARRRRPRSPRVQGSRALGARNRPRRCPASPTGTAYRTAAGTRTGEQQHRAARQGRAGERGRILCPRSPARGRGTAVGVEPPTAVAAARAPIDPVTCRGPSGKPTAYE